MISDEHDGPVGDIHSDGETLVHSNIPEAMEIVSLAGISSFMVPFIKAIATKAGEDCYQALRNLIRPREEQAADAEQVWLRDRENGTVLVFAPPLADEAIVKLAALKPRQISNRVLAWDSSAEEWKINRRN